MLNATDVSKDTPSGCLPIAYSQKHSELYHHSALVEPDRPEEYTRCYAEQKERKGMKQRNKPLIELILDINDFNGVLIVDHTSNIPVRLLVAGWSRVETWQVPTTF
jgi:hypothetical protein